MKNIRDLDKTKTYDLSDLSVGQLKVLADWFIKNKHNSQASFTRKSFLEWVEPRIKDCKLFIFKKTKNGDELWGFTEMNKDTIPTNALELFYTLENVQVDCTELNEEQIEDMYETYLNNNKKPLCSKEFALSRGFGSDYFVCTESCFYITNNQKNKHTITYDKFMELFGGCSVKDTNNKKLYLNIKVKKGKFKVSLNNEEISLKLGVFEKLSEAEEAVKERLTNLLNYELYSFK